MLVSLASLLQLPAADYQPNTLALGATAPDFSLPGVDGRNHALKDFAGAKVLVIVFTCTHCPTAQYYETRIKQLVLDYKDKGVSVVGIMPNDPKSVRLDELGWTDLSDSFEEMKVRARDRQYNFPYLYDGDTESVARAYGPVATPQAFVFDAARKLHYVGAIDDSERVQHVERHYLRDALDALLAGNEPAVTKTKVVGCSVKWAGKAESVTAYMEKLAAEPVSVAPIDAEGLKALRQNGSGKFEFLKQKQASCTNFIFASTDREKLINAFDPDWQGPVPYTVLISPEGKILYRETDRIDALAVKRAIVQALNEKKPW
jgi:peroxiredoxin